MADPIKVPLVAAADVERLGFVGRLMAAAKSLIFGSGGLENLAESNS
jgi:hypothetical protein